MANGKNEEVYLCDYASVIQAKKNLEAYYKFYNYKRNHQALNYKKPAYMFLLKIKNLR